MEFINVVQLSTGISFPNPCSTRFIESLTVSVSSIGYTSSHRWLFRPEVKKSKSVPVTCTIRRRDRVQAPVPAESSESRRRILYEEYKHIQYTTENAGHCLAGSVSRMSEWVSEERVRDFWAKCDSCYGTVSHPTTTITALIQWTHIRW